MGAFTRSRSGRVAGPTNLSAGLELDKPDAAQTSSLCGLSVPVYCVATCASYFYAQTSSLCGLSEPVGAGRLF